MAIIVKDRGGVEYTPHPEGQFPALCIDVVEMGWVETQYGYKYKIRVVFYCGETVEKEIDGEKKTFPLTVAGFFNDTLNEKGNLLPFLESWRGSALTAEERELFDLEKMIGKPALIQVKHNKSNNKTYANISSIMRLLKGLKAPTAPPEYVRVCNRPDWPGPAPHPAMSEPQEPATTYGSRHDNTTTAPSDNTTYRSGSSNEDDLPF